MLSFLSFPKQNPVCTWPVSHTCHISNPSHSSWFDYPNNIWWGVHFTKLLLLYSSPLPSYLILLFLNVFLNILFSDTLRLYFPITSIVWWPSLSTGSWYSSVPQEYHSIFRASVRRWSTSVYEGGARNSSVRIELRDFETVTEGWRGLQMVSYGAITSQNIPASRIYMSWPRKTKHTHTHNKKMIKIRGILGILQSRINKIDPLHLSRAIW